MLSNALKPVAVSAALLLPSTVLALSPVYTLQTGIGEVDIEGNSDNFYYLTGAALWSREMSYHSILDLQGEISTYEYSDNDDVDSEEIFLQGIYNYTPRAGFSVPTYSLGLRYTEEFLADDDMDASTLTLILSMSYRINDRTSVNGGFKQGEREAADDSSPSGYFVNLDYRYSPSWLWFTTLGSDEGVFTSRSYCSDAWRGGAGGSSWSGWSWSSWAGPGGAEEDCDTTYLTLGTSYIVDSFNTFEFSVSHREFDTPGMDLDGDILSVDYFHRF